MTMPRPVDVLTTQDYSATLSCVHRVFSDARVNFLLNERIHNDTNEQASMVPNG